jgi:hypothetical protein
MDPRLFADSQAGDWMSLGVNLEPPLCADLISWNINPTPPIEPHRALFPTSEESNPFWWTGLLFDHQQQFMQISELAIAQSSALGELNRCGFVDSQEPL